jgi:hypothetical protein
MMLLLTGCLIVFQNARFQTWLAQEAAKRLSEAIGAPVSIGKVKIRFFDRASISDFYVEDLHGDTLLFIGNLEANFDDVYLGFKHFDFERVAITNGQFNVRQFAGEEDLNIQLSLMSSTRRVRREIPAIQCHQNCFSGMWTLKILILHMSIATAKPAKQPFWMKILSNWKTSVRTWNAS